MIMFFIMIFTSVCIETIHRMITSFFKIQTCALDDCTVLLFSSVHLLIVFFIQTCASDASKSGAKDLFGSPVEGAAAAIAADESDGPPSIWVCLQCGHQVSIEINRWSLSFARIKKKICGGSFEQHVQLYVGERGSEGRERRQELMRNFLHGQL